MDSSLILIWLCILCTAVLLIMVFAKQMKMFIINSLCGLVGLWATNTILGAILGIQVGINILTVAAIGILGIPGYILLYAMEAIL